MALISCAPLFQEVLASVPDAVVIDIEEDSDDRSPPPDMTERLVTNGFSEAKMERLRDAGVVFERSIKLDD